MKAISNLCTALFFFVVMCSLALHAQTLPPAKLPFLFWFQIGYGTGSLNQTGGAGITFQFHQTVFTVRYTANGESDGKQLYDIAALIGVGKSIEYFHSSMSIGVGVVGGSERNGTYPAMVEIEPVIIFPIEAHIHYILSSFISVGMTGFFDFNRRHSLGGIIFGIQIGKLR